jgi:hypothetical protein
MFTDMKTFKSLLIVLLSLSVLSSCKKDEGISEVPEISFVSVVPNVVTAYQDSLVITISYRDGDGDLGENYTDDNNLFVQDSRNQVTYGFRIRQLAPDDATIAIEGELNVKLDNAPIINGGASESVTYTIWVVDRAGNISNRISSSSVTVNG